MKETLVSIDGAGRIVLPKDVREELAIKAGDTLSLSLQGSSVLLRTNQKKRGFKRKGKLLVFSSGGAELLDDTAVSSLLDEIRGEKLSQLNQSAQRTKQ